MNYILKKRPPLSLDLFLTATGLLNTSAIPHLLFPVTISLVRHIPCHTDPHQAISFHPSLSLRCAIFLCCSEYQIQRQNRLSFVFLVITNNIFDCAYFGGRFSSNLFAYVILNSHHQKVDGKHRILHFLTHHGPIIKSLHDDKYPIALPRSSRT